MLEFGSDDDGLDEKAIEGVDYADVDREFREPASTSIEQSRE